MKTKLISLIGITLMASAVQAEDVIDKNRLAFEPKFRFFLEAGVAAGGDGSEPLPIFNRADGLYYTGIPLTLFGNWQGVSSDLEQTWQDEAEAGGFYKFSAGVEIPISQKFMVSASYGYLGDEIYGDLTDGSGGNGSFGYSRQTLEVVPFFNYERHRIGIGAVLHFGVEATHKEYGSGFDLKTSYDFDDTFGAVLQYDYLVSENTSLGVRYTEMSYDFDSLTTSYTIGGNSTVTDADCLSSCEDVVEANSFGAHITYRF